jgi:hypothetical protein
MMVCILRHFDGRRARAGNGRRCYGGRMGVPIWFVIPGDLPTEVDELDGAVGGLAGRRRRAAQPGGQSLGGSAFVYLRQFDLRCEAQGVAR